MEDLSIIATIIIPMSKNSINVSFYEYGDYIMIIMNYTTKIVGELPSVDFLTDTKNLHDIMFVYMNLLLHGDNTQLEVYDLEVFAEWLKNSDDGDNHRLLSKKVLELYNK